MQRSSSLSVFLSDLNKMCIKISANFVISVIFYFQMNNDKDIEKKAWTKFQVWTLWFLLRFVAFCLFNATSNIVRIYKNYLILLIHYFFNIDIIYLQWVIKDCRLTIYILWIQPSFINFSRIRCKLANMNNMSL